MQTKRIDALAIASCFISFILWILISNYRYDHFCYSNWDLTFFAQAMWNLSHGINYVSVFGTNFLANHANLIAYLILPIYKIFPHPMLLVYLKIISYIVAAYILYILTKEKLGGWTAFIIMWLYLIYPSNVFGIFFEFDFESLAPVLLMLLYYFYIKDRWRGFMVCALILILIKENLPLIILAFGIHGLMTKKAKVQWGIFPIALAIISLCLFVLILIPLASGRPVGQPHPYYVSYCFQPLWQVLYHPWLLGKTIWTADNLNWFIAIFNPLLYLPFISPGTLFLISPILMQHLLSASPTEHKIYFGYVLTIAPFVFLAAAQTLQLLARFLKRLSYLVVFILLFLGVINFCSNFKYMQQYCQPAQPDSLNKERWEMVHAVPADASVVATFNFLPALSQRQALYAFYNIYNSEYASFKLPSSVQYALIDFNDPSLVSFLNLAPNRERVKTFFKSGDWFMIKKYDQIELFKRKDGGKS